MESSLHFVHNAWKLPADEKFTKATDDTTNAVVNARSQPRRNENLRHCLLNASMPTDLVRRALQALSDE